MALAIGLWVGAYLLGAIPFGLILAHKYGGIDVRKAGSGNIGATNVARTAGKKLGYSTLALDAAKGAIPVLISQHVFHQSLEVTAGAGLATVLGHVFPIYLKLKGGKGVATAGGVFLAISPIPSLIAVGVFGVLALLTRIVSASSLAAALALAGALWFLDGRRPLLYLAAAVVPLIFIRHAGNIRRLLRKSENTL